MKYVIGFLASLIPAGLVAWFFWGPVLSFFMSLIPASAEYAWVGKILVTIIVAWLGGIGIPLFIAILGIGLFVTLSK